MTDYSAELGHVQLEVADLERAASFYETFLGLRVSERMESRKGRVVLLSGGQRHSEVTLRAAPSGDGRLRENGDRAGGGGRRVHRAGSAFSAPFQLVFEVPDHDAFADLFFELRRAGIPTTAVDHGVSWAVYFRDPDGNALGAYWDTREEEGGRSRWGGQSQLLGLHEILPEEKVQELVERRQPKDEAGVTAAAEGGGAGAPEAPGEEGASEGPATEGNDEDDAGPRG